MKKLVLKIVVKLKLLFFKRRLWSVAIKIYEFEKWIRNEPERKCEFNPGLEETTRQLIVDSFKLISRLKNGEKINEEDEKQHIANIKMHHALMSSNPLGEYIDLAKIRKKLKP